jgi:hypothetical protein
MVACVQTFGNFANFHPHLHILVTDGGFAPNGASYVLPKVSLSGFDLPHLIGPLLGLV